jgi:hypothetical protein
MSEVQNFVDSGSRTSQGNDSNAEASGRDYGVAFADMLRAARCQAARALQSETICRPRPGAASVESKSSSVHVGWGITR